MKYIFLLLLLVSFGRCLAQDQTANWYFGENAGLRFNADGTVEALTDGKINTLEGSSTISDEEGNLLLYTDGITVYNGRHEIITNGTGLHGHPSSTQSSIIIPSLVDPNIFYIFTIDTIVVTENEIDVVNEGLKYSEVDISKNNNRGEVTQKNVPLLKNCSEKIAAVVKDCSDDSIWVVALAAEDGENNIFNTFYAYEVNNQVNAPVKSTVRNFTDKRGYLKFTSDGKKMASANGSNGLYLYDFNSQTGRVTNEQNILFSNHDTNPYGIEFSPNNRFLYVHTYLKSLDNDDDLNSDNHFSDLLQYDLWSNDISVSEVKLDTRNGYRGALQLGSNGKIYRAITYNYYTGTRFLGVINNPNEKGIAADYEHNAIHLKGKNVNQGLPPFIQSFFNTKSLITNADGTKSDEATYCAGSAVTLETDEMPNAWYTWRLNGKDIENDSNILYFPSITFADSGTYELTIHNADSSCDIIIEAQVTVSSIPQVDEPLTISKCDVDANNTDGFTNFNLELLKPQLISDDSHILSFYESDDFDVSTQITNPENYINTTSVAQKIYFRVVDTYECSNTGEIDLEVNPSGLDLSNDQTFFACTNNNETLEGIFDLDKITNSYFFGLPVTYYVKTEDVTLDNPITTTTYTSTTATIYAKVYDENECLGVEEIKLEVIQEPVLDFETTGYIICSENPTITIPAPDGFDVYEWYSIGDNGTEKEIGVQQNITLARAGDFKLTVGYLDPNGGTACTTSTTFTIDQSNTAKDITITLSKENEDISSDTNDVSAEVNVTGDGNYEYALNINGPYQDSPLFEHLAIGFHTVYIRDKNQCGIVEKEIAVYGYKKFFTPNGDGQNDYWNVVAATDSPIFISIFDRYGNLMHTINDVNSLGWDGTTNGMPAPISDYWVVISYKDHEYKDHFTLKR